jgi:hypothetical protein
MIERPPAPPAAATHLAWPGAPFQGAFTLLGKDAPATQQTNVAVLCDGKTLYVGFICAEDNMANLVTKVTAHDGPVYTDDCVELFIAPSAAKPQIYYHFVVNAAGTFRDEIGQDPRWESDAKVATSRDAKGWTAQIAIPLALLGIDASVGETWRINFGREEQPHGEVSSWSPCKSGFHEPENFGTLTGMKLDYVPLIAKALRDLTGSGLKSAEALLAAAEPYRQTDSARRFQASVQAQSSALGKLRERLASARLNPEDLRDISARLDRAEGELQRLSDQTGRLRLEAAAADRGYVVCPETPMNKVRYDQPYNGAPGSRADITLAKNSYEATQIVVVPVADDLSAVTCAVSDLGGPKGARIAAADLTVNLVGYANIEKPSGGAKLPKGMIPDPLLPNSAVDIPRNQLRSFWVTVHAAPDQPAGIYRGKITITPRNAKPTQIDLSARVWNFALPLASRLKSDWQIIWSLVWPRHDLVAAPGVPKDWIGGAWVGDDVTGKKNYFGTADFVAAFDTQVKHKGSRSLRVTSTKIEPGTVEAPRFCWYTEPLKLTPNTDYELTFWYRTQGMMDTGVGALDGQSQGADFPPSEGEWKQARWALNSKDGERRIYIRVNKTGTVWVDDARLAPVGAAADVNVLPNPDFEEGKDTDREQLARAYRLNSLQHRCSDQNIATPDIKTDDSGKVTIDWTKFDRDVEFYLAHGQNAFNISWAQLPGGWGTVEAVEDQQRIARCKEILRQTQAHLEEKGWLDYAYIYTIDEPGKAAFPQVKQAFGLVHEVAPKLKCLLTYGYGASRPIEPGNPVYKDLAGFVNIHVPHSDCFEPVFLKERQKLGDEIWAYVCISAQNPYLNCWGIDYPGIEQRMLYWQLFSHDITGFLYWATTYWPKDPWKEPLTYPGGNSDGSMIYPGADGPVNSVRWELTRDGIEDYDMMVMLAEKACGLAKAGDTKLAEQCRQALDLRAVTAGWTKYTEDPAVLMARRQAIGGTLERVLNGPGAKVEGVKAWYNDPWWTAKASQ